MSMVESMAVGLDRVSWACNPVQASTRYSVNPGRFLSTKLTCAAISRPLVTDRIETTLSSFNGLRIGPEFPSYNQLFLSKDALKCHKLFESRFVVRAAWTRRSKGEGPKKSRKSFKQRTEKFMKPFMLDVFISSKYVHAKVMHRVTSKVVSVATTNAKDLRNSLPSLTDINACKTIGRLIADRSKEADVYAVTFELRKGEKMEGKLAVVVDTLVENGVALV